jgi:hypothetical protein
MTKYGHSVGFRRRLSGDWTVVCLSGGTESLSSFIVLRGNVGTFRTMLCPYMVAASSRLAVRLTSDGLIVCWSGAHADPPYCVERQLYTAVVSLYLQLRTMKMSAIYEFRKKDF